MAFRLIIDSRPEGLPHAPEYYRFFPQEPSPVADMSISQQTTAVLTNTSLDTVLDEMLRVTAGSVVMLVCHAFQQGLLMPIVPGGANQRLLVPTMAIIDKVIKAESDVVDIRALPTGTPEQEKLAVDRWTRFLNDLQPGMVTGAISRVEAENAYGNWLDNAATALEFRGSQARDKMRNLLRKLRQVRDLKLSRIELRACNIGGNVGTMETVRKFFGCERLVAPMVGTFYLGAILPFTVQALAVNDDFLGRPPQHRARVPAPLGMRPAPDSLRSITALRNHTTRAFPVRANFPGASLTVSPQLTPHLYGFTLTVDELAAYRYRAWTSVDRAAAGGPDWGKVQFFVRGWIMPGAAYTGGAFPLAGLWTPDIQDTPFVLPQETSYMKLMISV